MWCSCVMASFLACASLAGTGTSQEVDRVAAYLRLVDQFNRASASQVSQELATWEPAAVRQVVDALLRVDRDRVTPRAVLMELHTALWSLQHGRPEINGLHLELAIKLSTDDRRVQRVQSERAFYEPFYLLISSVFQRQWRLSAAAGVLDYAVRVFPENLDARVTLGAISEAAASRQGQLMSGGANWPEWLRDRKSNLLRAEEAYRRVLERDRTNDEAAVRLASVLYGLGQVDDARRVAREVGLRTDDKFLRYMTAMLLGRIEQDAGNQEGSVEHYRHATRLFPQSQAAFVALSHARTLLGDVDDAARIVEDMLDQSAAKTDDDDPWWQYHFGQVRHFSALMDQLWAAAIE
jgi:tetratricopeptide (TPR) repeat protein